MQESDLTIPFWFLEKSSFHSVKTSICDGKSLKIKVLFCWLNNTPPPKASEWHRSSDNGKSVFSFPSAWCHYLPNLSLETAPSISGALEHLGQLAGLSLSSYP